MSRLGTPVAAVTALAWLVATTVATAQARPVTLDDILSMRTFGAAALSPDGRWAVYERRGPYDASPRFDRGARSWWAGTELMIMATAGGRPAPLLPAETGSGLLIGSWSPGGRRLLIYRLTGDRLEAGIVTPAEKRVLWTGLTPDLPTLGAGSGWVDDERLALTVRPDESLPWMLRFDGSGRDVMDRRWAATKEGTTPSRTVFDTRDAAATVDAKALPLRLVLFDTKGGGTRLLLEGAIRDFAVSPDGRQIAVLEAGDPTPLAEAERNVQSAVLVRGRLSLVSTDGANPILPADRPDVAPHLLRWSSASDEVLVWTRRDDQSWAEGALTAIGLDGRLRTIASDGLSPTSRGRTIDDLRAVRADWLGESVILYARTTTGDRFDWWRLGEGGSTALTTTLDRPPDRLASVQKDTALLYAEGALWEMTMGGLRRLTSTADVWRQAEPDDPMRPVRIRATASKRDWAVAASGSRIAIQRGDGSAGWMASLACAQGPHVRAAGPTAALVLCVEKGVETLSLATSAGVRPVDRVNAAFNGLLIPQGMPILHRDHRGRETRSFLYMPPGVPASEVKGVLVQVYPGVADDGRRIEAQSLQSSLRPQVLALGGYAVLSVGLPSQVESARAAMFDDFARGVDLAVDAALAAAPDLPRDRLALVGHSFGGYAALAVATQSARFQSYAVWATPTDMAGKWGEFMSHGRLWPEDGFTLNQTIGAVETGQAKLEGPPWSDTDVYAAASPYLLADRIRAPVLLITADRDYVPMTQSERLFTALHRQGRRARLVTYWGEGHDNASPANIRDVYQQIFTWLEETLASGSVRPPAPDGPPRP